ncbi:hypothetical protein AC579_4739 [Pseudocercospora musae]|uniref:Uncharacterized protein n=1 Tax=Pseudocercospora musae TaxID=113226 RepID=A0A139IQ52_9PEZI|nr:hypothetical protein AC579_4739 [Pseudocercospora musae]
MSLHQLRPAADIVESTSIHVKHSTECSRSTNISEGIGEGHLRAELSSRFIFARSRFVQDLSISFARYFKEQGHLASRKRFFIDQFTTNAMPAKRAVPDVPLPQPDSKMAKTRAGSVFHTGRHPALMRELAIAKEAFEEQEETIRQLNQEASDHETLLRQQEQQISRLTEVPYTAAQDYAEVLAHANGKLHREVAALKDRNSVLETELCMARILFEKLIPAETALKEENERLRAAMALLQMKNE